MIKMLAKTICFNLAFLFFGNALAQGISNAKDATFNEQRTNNTQAKLAIIMDDIGAKASDKHAFSLPRYVTFAVLPHTEYSTEFSYKAAGQNREVMLHMPMESLHDVNLGPYPLLSTMYPAEVRDTLLHALQTVPHAVGVNNHMGSKLTQMTLQMNSVMQVLASSNLFFIDSKTTKFSKAKSIATSKGVKTATRHVFLDHEKSPAFLQQQFTQAVRIARQYGKAILIAHPYQISIDFLDKTLDTLPQDIQLVTVSEFLNEKQKFRINPHLITKYQSKEQVDRFERILQSDSNSFSPND